MLIKQQFKIKWIYTVYR